MEDRHGRKQHGTREADLLIRRIDESAQTMIDTSDDATELKVTIEYLDGPHAGQVLAKTYRKQEVSG